MADPHRLTPHDTTDRHENWRQDMARKRYPVVDFIGTMWQVVPTAYVVVTGTVPLWARIALGTWAADTDGGAEPPTCPRCDHWTASHYLSADAKTGCALCDCPEFLFDTQRES